MLVRDTITFGKVPAKALAYAIWVSKSFKQCTVDREPSLDLVMSLHVLTALYCNLRRFEKAVLAFEKAI